MFLGHWFVKSSRSVEMKHPLGTLDVNESRNCGSNSTKLFSFWPHYQQVHSENTAKGAFLPVIGEAAFELANTRVSEGVGNGFYYES